MEKVNAKCSGMTLRDEAESIESYSSSKTKKAVTKVFHNNLVGGEERGYPSCLQDTN